MLHCHLEDFRVLCSVKAAGISQHFRAMFRFRAQQEKQL